MHQIISQRKDDNDLDIDDAKAADVGASGSTVSSSSRRSRAKNSRIASAASSSSLISSASNSRLSVAASTDSLVSTYSASGIDSLLPVSTAASASSLMSMSRLHTAPSAESQEASRMCVDTRKFDFSAAVTEPTQSSVSGPVTSETPQPACDRVKFTTGHSMEFLMPDITSGGTVEKKPLISEVDSAFGRTDVSGGLKTENWMSKNVDGKCENLEMMMTKAVKDEVMTSLPDTDIKMLSAAAAVSVSQGNTEEPAELKPGLDKPCTAGAVVAVSSLVSSSSATAVSSTATSGATELPAVASASDLKKESQAINYDWVSNHCLHYISYHSKVQMRCR